MTQAKVKAPRHVEIWGEIEAQNRFLRRLALGASLWAFAALAGTAYALEVALFRPLAFHVDDDGRSTFVGRLRESAGPSEPEVRYVARDFLTHYVALNSLTIEADLAAAWNLMTDELRADSERQLADYRRANEKDFASFVREEGIQMILDLPSEKIRVTEHDARAWTVHLTGVAHTWPLGRVGDAAASQDRDLEAIVTLVRCPRTEKTPNGLLVAKVATRFFVAEKTDGAGPGADSRPAERPPSAAASPGKE